MKISKQYHWEMGHRLPYHKGLCKNIHGHSYRMNVEITGGLDKNGMIIDFFDLNKIVKPIIEKYDHAFLCWKGDKKVLNFLVKNKMKKVVVDYHSTVENICSDFTDKLTNELLDLKGHKFEELTVKIYESPNSYAEKSRLLAKGLML
ncbi:MAG TPA: 6-carboxytetrahydropterin synthase [Ignavibacteria bacterium]|nr:6-carboxytetrahydropterin synthase [Bacteroidota bacterium]HRE10259.1 6-carboxytetrahydropterin synthase [Ignavibacteria bacterium]HRF67115.1 6-carboxytetrahydropterin synthase [Ignavibacteria bacterium]HRJ04449.1 6-carboxytetrahydropterin synthase [Ignavibacteria bacterium]HRJ85969.1 6-carboxytetrahydropterin synthase [Ignavibacteria bacterium]